MVEKIALLREIKKFTSFNRMKNGVIIWAYIQCVSDFTMCGIIRYICIFKENVNNKLYRKYSEIKLMTIIIM